MIKTLLLVVACLILTAGCTSTELVLPGQIRALPNPEDTREAILAGIERRRWILGDESPGRILARIDVRRHTAEVWVEYDEESIRFRYGGSRGLDCRPAGEACRSIHGSYNRWTRNLAIAIAAEVAERRVTRSPAAGGQEE